MPAPGRYEHDIPEMTQLWKSEGTFDNQMRVWGAHVQARHEVEGAPSAEDLELIKGVLVLTQDEIAYLEKPEGHETVRLQRLLQGKLPEHLRDWIHRGATSSDILDTGFALQTLQALDILAPDYAELEAALLTLSLQYRNTLTVGKSHGQDAIPFTFGRRALGWYAGVKEADRRIDQVRDVMSFGKWSGEIGTHVFNSPELEERAMAILDLRSEKVPTQVIPRWRHAEALSLMALNGVALETMATNIRLLALSNVGEVREPFDKHGSSAMPHKRNPELSERICGLGRIVRSSMLAQHEAVALWLERDMSHSSTERFTFPDSFQSLDYMVRLGTRIIKGMVVYTDRMAENLDVSRGGIYSARLLNIMMDHGASRNDTHDRVKLLAQKALDERSHLKDLVMRDPYFVDLIPADLIEDIFEPQAYLKNIGVAYQRLEIDGSEYPL